MCVRVCVCVCVCVCARVCARAIAVSDVCVHMCSVSVSNVLVMPRVHRILHHNSAVFKMRQSQVFV